ncbi:MAG: VWA domain-containing protein [Planctomycetota bacterium]
MKFPHLLFVAALILWIGSIWPGHLRSGDTWILLDRSPSMGLEPDLETWLEQSGLNLDEWKLAVRKQRVLSFPNPHGIATTDLAEALRQMREKLSPPDRLIVRTDGRALSAFSDPESWAGIEVLWVPPLAQPQFHQILAPSTWPAQGDVWIRVRMQNADLASGKLDFLDASHQITALEILNQGDAWFALHLSCAQTPTQTLRLQLRWTEAGGQATTSLRILAQGREELNLIPSNTAVDVIRRRLAQGEVLVVASADFLSWKNLPADLKLFESKPETETKPLWVLLDVSGSMEGRGLEEARAALAQLRSSWNVGPIYVVPFQQSLLDTISLSTAEAATQLDQLSAFGPTHLAEALQSLAPKLQGSHALLILSDGAAGTPDLNWESFLQQTLPEVRVFCLPTGPDAEWDFLAGLGEVLLQGEIQDRLNQVLGELQNGGLAPVLPLHPSSFPLPDSWQPEVEHPAWAFASGAEGLMQDSMEQAYLAVRRVGAGLLIGLADTYSPRHQQLLGPIQAQFHSPGHSGWVSGRFLVQDSPQAPRCFQDHALLEVHLVEASSPLIWQVPFASPLKPVEVWFENGTHWTAAALTSPEFGVPPKLWISWLENHRNVLTTAVFRPRLLWAGLFLLSIAFVLRNLSHR